MTRITNDEAIELLVNIAAYDIDSKRGEKKFEALWMAIKALEQTRWIPISSGELPKPYEHVIRTVRYDTIDGNSYTYVDISPVCPGDKEVLAWMPSPKPYEIESEE